MKRLPKNKLVLIVARDWESNPTWQSEEARKEPANPPTTPRLATHPGACQP